MAKKKNAWECIKTSSTKEGHLFELWVNYETGKVDVWEDHKMFTNLQVESKPLGETAIKFFDRLVKHSHNITVKCAIDDFEKSYHGIVRVFYIEHVKGEEHTSSVGLLRKFCNDAMVVKYVFNECVTMNMSLTTFKIGNRHVEPALELYISKEDYIKAVEESKKESDLLRAKKLCNKASKKVNDFYKGAK